MPIKAWTTKSTREIYRNKWMALREDVAIMPNGRETIYGVCTFGQCVGVLPFVDADRVVLVRQYRYVQQEDFRWEMPTGGIKEGESAEDAAQRELAEEAGYIAGRLERINTYYTSKSVCDETAHLFIGYDLIQESLPPDDTEFFEVKVFPFGEALQMVRESQIRDGMSVIAILEAALRRMSG